MIGTVVIAALLSGATPPALTPPERRGRAIYLHGRSTAGRGISAFFGADGSSEIDASVVPCASCHGADGRGVAEGTVAPSDIRWRVLSKFHVASEGERRRPAYDDGTLARAVREAIDAGGVALGAIMPRYGIGDADLADLLAYLRRLGNEPRPGLDDAAITIATVLPSSGAGNAMRAVVAGYLDDINAEGGLFGRRLRLEAIDPAAPPGHIARSLAGEIFAVLGGSWSDGDPVDEVIRDERIPVVTPFAAGGRSAPSAFTLFPDLESQALALIEFAAGRTAAKSPRIAVIHHGSEAAAAVTRRCESLGWTVTENVSPDLDFVLLIGSGTDVRSIADGPQILIAGGALMNSLFEMKGKTILAAVPSLPSDLTEEGKREMVSFAGRHRLSGANRAAEIAAYAAAKVLVEGIRRSGRDISREKLIATLEQLYEFQTGLTRPITYGPARHAGAIGAHIVAVDFERRTFVPAGGWITPAE